MYASKIYILEESKFHRNYSQKQSSRYFSGNKVIERQKTGKLGDYTFAITTKLKCPNSRQMAFQIISI